MLVVAPAQIFRTRFEIVATVGRDGAVQLIDVTVADHQKSDPPRRVRR